MRSTIISSTIEITLRLTESARRLCSGVSVWVSVTVAVVVCIAASAAAYVECAATALASTSSLTLVSIGSSARRVSIASIAVLAVTALASIVSTRSTLIRESIEKVRAVIRSMVRRAPSRLVDADSFCERLCDVAQLVERAPVKRMVTGSIPVVAELWLWSRSRRLLVVIQETRVRISSATPRCCRSVVKDAALSARRSRVQIPSAPPISGCSSAVERLPWKQEAGWAAHPTQTISARIAQLVERLVEAQDAEVQVLFRAPCKHRIAAIAAGCNPAVERLRRFESSCLQNWISVRADYGACLLNRIAQATKVRILPDPPFSQIV